MKKITYLLTLVLLGTLSSCDKGFDQLNISPVSPVALNPVFTFNNALLNSTFGSSTLVFEEAIVQQIYTPNNGVNAGGNFNIDNRGPSGVNGGIWHAYYQNVIRYLVDNLNQTKADANRTNFYNMVRIWKAYAFLVLTDTYGDVPYTDAGLGYLASNVTPKYDAQEAIYTDIIKELTEASANLDATKPIETGEVLYGGNIPKWKRLGYSLLLRAGMRLTKVNPTLAQATVVKAVAGGVFQANADNAVIRNDANYQNGVGVTLNSSEAANFYLARPLVDYLKSTNDPRLASIAVRYVGAASGPEQTAAKANRDPAVQIGIPIGLDQAGVGAKAVSEGLKGFYEYSQLDRTRLAKQTAPTFFVTHAQTQLLLAEAAYRGWTTGNAADYYTAGVTAHMQQLGDYDATSLVPPAAIAAYLTANPYSTARGLELINTQYWVASLLNGPEVFANFRRSGYPKLTPNTYSGREIKGSFINRLSYPDSEISVNTAKVNEAIARQGADNLDTRVWWDKQ